MGSQDGKGLLGFLVATLIVFGIAWLAFPLLQRSTYSNNESAAVGTLRQIYQAQTDHYGGSRMYGSLARIQVAGISSDNFSSNGYEFFHSTTGAGTAWCAVAIPQLQTQVTAIGEPERREGKVFGINETGVVLQGVSMSACYGGTLDTAGGSPVR